MDLKNILNDIEINDDENPDSDIKNNPNVKVHKKPVQLKDIERRSKTNHSKNSISLVTTHFNYLTRLAKETSKYNNYKFLYSSKEIQKEVFIEGISGSLDIP